MATVAKIHQIEKLDDVAETLEELWISYNQITVLDGLSNLSHLTRLYISNNSVKNWSELDKLVSAAVTTYGCDRWQSWGLGHSSALDPPNFGEAYSDR